MKCHKLFKFFTEIWNFSTWQNFLHIYNPWYPWQIWGLIKIWVFATWPGTWKRGRQREAQRRREKRRSSRRSRNVVWLLPTRFARRIALPPRFLQSWFAKENMKDRSWSLRWLNHFDWKSTIAVVSIWKPTNSSQYLKSCHSSQYLKTNQ